MTVTNQQCDRPGIEGCCFRLARAWNPDPIGAWIDGEKARGNDVIMMARALAEVAAAASFGFANTSSSPETVVFHDRIGLIILYVRSLKSKFERAQQNKTTTGLFVPNAEDLRKFG